MANEFQEKEFDDEVYEDDFYDDEEELEDEDTSSLSDDDSSEVEEVKVHMSFACEDCDYRWDDIIVKIKGNLEDEEEEIEVICPMCGSMNITQI
jgi:Zn finger protein HypA/HybF involved in hydrogenase expression